MKCFFFFQAEDGIRDGHVTGVQTCALPISLLHEALRIHRDLGDRWRMASVLDDLAAAALAVRPPGPAQAARLLGAAQHIREAIGTTVAPCERADHARTEAAARAALGEA